MVDAEDFPEGAVDVEGKIGDAASRLAEVEAGDVGFGDAGVDLLHGQVRVAGDEGEGSFGEGFAWGDLKA